MSESRIKVIACAMAAGLTLVVGLVAWRHQSAAGTVPTANQLRSLNFLTTIAMASAIIAIAASEILWRRVLRGARGPVSARAPAAFLARLACREGAALPGLTVAYIAAEGGVLRAYPAYWANLAPYALFLVFLATHRPSEVLRGVTNVTP